MHGGEQRPTEHSGHTHHVEGVHQNVVLSLEHQHEVEGTRDTQGHPVREGALTDGVDQEHSGGSGHRGRVSHADPGAHTEAVAQFPLTTHVAEDADEEVENHQLVGATVVQPLIQGSGFPDGVEVQTDSVGGRNNSTRDDVVAVHQGASNRLTDAVDVHGGSSNEGDYETGGSSQQSGDHQHAEPANVQAVFGAGHPLAELLPEGGRLLPLKGCGHG
ncbi:hypothetical protein GFS31_44030 (plasmid) [Leptolyngbya sp. BL0902]|nr:hypothetical protein GFS31_44030 [Leptolyngbya sp. BL0902]